jgi:pyruvate kinase
MERRAARRARIVATVGPATETPEAVAALVTAGADVARLNFSHGGREDHAAALARLRAAAAHAGRPLAVLQDLQGPKIRTGPLRAGRAGVVLAAGAELAVVGGRELAGDAQRVSTTYPHLAEDVRPGDRILLDDGRIALRVVATDGAEARCEVVHGGVLHERKGVNLPGVPIRQGALTEKDRADLAFGLGLGVDAVALSFVRAAEDVLRCRAEMERAGRVVPIVAKIEKPEAIAALEEILGASDGVLVARGDLGVEVEPWRVPGLQKEIVRAARRLGKPAIVATQMLESMIEHPRPTRAEASDVANAVWDGADALMLSGETAVGKHAIAAVEAMDRVIREAEAEPRFALPVERADGGSVPRVVAAAARRAAEDAGAAAICCFTQSGETARLLAAERPRIPIVAYAEDDAVRRRLALYWGIVPRPMPAGHDADAACDAALAGLEGAGIARAGERVVLVFGTRLGIAGMTNSIRIAIAP